MEPATISLIVSAIVACIQIGTFLENRIEKKESRLNIFSKASDVKNELDEIRVTAATSSTELNNEIETHSEKLQKLATCQAVLNERIDNTVESLDKIENKLDKILERI